MHRDAADVIAPLLDLAGVESGPNGQAQARQGRIHRQRATDRAAGSVKCREHTVPRRLDQPTALLFDQTACDAIVLVELDGRRFDVRVLTPEPPWVELAERRRQRTAASAAGAGGRDAIVSPMQGTVLSVQVAEGDSIRAGQVICIVEAMKMENEVHAVRAGIVSGLTVSPGEAVRTGQVICVVVPEADAGA
jgi:biotin carboxyl carrier protein